ncbi:hypothetical protein ACH4OY_20680 [Micromonospora rubida]|uniref:Uncharacterized protein n=1 Tax=Micromonospora rubida TaxID=2697657 RepID=A0ABW7SQV4_9ACTN
MRHGLVLTADNDGLILDFRHDEFHNGPLVDAMPERTDVWDWSLTYDEFVALPLTELMFELVEAGLLATRGNSDSVDYRLTLPGGAGVSDEPDQPEPYGPLTVDIDPWGGMAMSLWVNEPAPPSAPGPHPVPGPEVELTLRATANGEDLLFMYRKAVSDLTIDAMIDALSRARDEARRQATLRGWKPWDLGLDRFPPPF